MSSKTKANSAANPPVRRRRFLRLCITLGMTSLVVLAGYCVYLDSQIRSMFDGRKWSMPAKVYAQPLVLTEGMALNRQQLLASLQRTGYQSRDADPYSSIGSFLQQGNRWQVQRRSFSYGIDEYPAADVRFSLLKGEIRNLTLNGQQQLEVVLEPEYLGGIVPQQTEDRELIRLADVPPTLVAALVMIEDRNFFDHYGVSPRGIARAIYQNAKAGRTVQGGSTLTQQLVKNFFLSSQRSLRRKINEALMSLLLEMHYSKEEILETYINEVYFGQSGTRAIHGFELAARFYFGRPLAELGLAEHATLVGMVKGPSLYNPRRNPQRSLERRNLVLSVLEQQQVISAVTAQQAKQRPMLTAKKSNQSNQRYPAFLQLVKRQLRDEYSTTDLQSAGLKIFTTLNPEYQRALETSAAQQLNRLSGRSDELEQQLQVAALITEASDGSVRALIGGRNSRFEGFNRALDIRRSIGSLAKPAVYLSALKTPNYHWGSVISDTPVAIAGPNQEVWRPQNYDKQSHGEVTLIEALTKSYNQATARLGMEVGLDRVAAEFQRLGIDDPLPVYPSLLLGSSELSPMSVAQMYQTMAAQGQYLPLKAIDVVTRQGIEVPRLFSTEPDQRYDRQLMRWLEYGMRQVIQSGTARRLGRDYGDNIAGKTGTSDQQRDAWFAGFDRKLLGVVWVGRDDNKPMPFTGSSAALPIWKGTFDQIGIHDLDDQHGLRYAAVDVNGQIQGEGCDGEQLLFPPERLQNRGRSCLNPIEKIEQKVKRWWQQFL